MDSTPTAGGGTTVALRGAIAAVIVATTAAFAAPLNDAATKGVSEIGSFTTGVALVGLMAWAAHRTTGWDRVGWLMMTVPTGFLIVAYGVDPIDPAAPIGPVPLAFHVGPWATLIHIFAIGVLARRIVTRVGVLRIVLDSLWLGMGVLLVSWNLVGGPVVNHESVGGLSLVALVSQTLATALLAGTLIVLFHHATTEGRLSLAVLGAPAALLAISQGLFGRALIAGDLGYGSLADFAFPLAFGVGALATLETHRVGDLNPRVRRPGAAQMMITWIPLLAWALTAALVEMSVLREQQWLGVLVAVLAVARLSFLAAENRGLARTLHARFTSDPLTGLPNRAGFEEMVAGIHSGGAGLLLIDLDRFKAINDTLGRATGDELLVLVSRRIRNAVGKDWTVMRLAGDEFVALTTVDSHPEKVVEMGYLIIERLALPFRLNGREAWLGSSVGAASTHDDLRPSDLLAVADLALRTAQDLAKGQVVTADADLRRRARDRDDLEYALRHAVDRGELFTLFQPKIDLITGAMVGVEALVRWDRPGVGVVPPGEFIPVAEASGLIAKVDGWVLADAVGHLHRWNRMRTGGPRLKLSSNMSAWQLARVDVDEEVSRTLAWEGGVDPAQVMIELTETLLVEDPVIVARRLEKLRAIGVGISVDDFGAGFTSIAYLRKFPISEVKIDRDLVWELTGEPEDEQSLVAAVMALAQAMNLEVVAEGVETREQASSLRRLGCRVAQGFLYAKPLSVAEIDELVTQEFPFAALVADSDDETASLRA